MLDSPPIHGDDSYRLPHRPSAFTARPTARGYAPWVFTNICAPNAGSPSNPPAMLPAKPSAVSVARSCLPPNPRPFPRRLHRHPNARARRRRLDRDARSAEKMSMHMSRTCHPIPRGNKVPAAVFVVGGAMALAVGLTIFLVVRYREKAWDGGTAVAKNDPPPKTVTGTPTVAPAGTGSAAVVPAGRTEEEEEPPTVPTKGSPAKDPPAKKGSPDLNDILPNVAAVRPAERSARRRLAAQGPAPDQADRPGRVEADQLIGGIATRGRERGAPPARTDRSRRSCSAS